MEEVSVGRWANGAASSVMTTSASGMQEIRKGVCGGGDVLLLGTCFVCRDSLSETRLCGERERGIIVACSC